MDRAGPPGRTPSQVAHDGNAAQAGGDNEVGWVAGNCVA